MSTFNRWYARHSEEFNAKRRERYKKDAAYRKKATQSNAAVRSKVKIEREAQSKIVVVEGKSIEVMTAGEVARTVDRSPQLIRVWEQKGLLPLPTITGAHRLYTMNQVRLIQYVAKAVRLYGASLSTAEVKSAQARCFDNWTAEPKRRS